MGGGEGSAYGSGSPSGAGDEVALSSRITIQRISFADYRIIADDQDGQPTHIIQLVQSVPGKRLFLMFVTMMFVMVMLVVLDERFVSLSLALSREPRAQCKDWPESVSEDHVDCRVA